MKSQTTEKKNNGHMPGKGILGTSSSGEFPAQLLKANNDFHEAMANCRIRDEKQLVAITLYAGHLASFDDMVEELEDLTNFLNGSVSVNMASRAQALQGHVGLFFPTTSGMKVGKDEALYMKKANEESIRKRKNGHEDNHGGDLE